jgi:peptidyl-prolyl cis-trans isomerase C
MTKTNLSKKSLTNTDAQTGDKKTSKFLWPFGVVIGLVVIIGLVLIYLAVQTYTSEKSDNASVTPTNTDKSQAAEETPVAMANGYPISRKIYEEMINVSLSQQGASEGIDSNGAPKIELKLELLNSLVTMVSAVQEAYRLGFGPSELEVESAINQMVGDYGSREAFEKALPAFGTDLASLRKQVADNLALRSWRDTAFIKEALVTDEEAKAFYEEHKEEATHDEQVRAVQIMLPVPLTSGQEDAQAKEIVRSRAEAIYQEALAGANFDELIERHTDPATRAASQGGQMGWISRGAMDFDELEQVLFSLEPGQVGGPVESQFSYHIVKVIEKRPAGVISFEEIKPEILEYLLSIKTERMFLETLTELRNKTTVEVLDKEIAEAWPAFQEKLKQQNQPTNTPVDSTNTDNTSSEVQTDELSPGQPSAAEAPKLNETSATD